MRNVNGWHRAPADYRPADPVSASALHPADDGGGHDASAGQDDPKVLQIIDNLALGGAQRLLVMLAVHLGRREPLQVLSLIAADSMMRTELLASGAVLQETRRVKLWNPLSWVQVARAIRVSGAGVVHVHLTYATILAVPLARMLGRRVVVSLHNADTSRSSGGGVSLRRRVLKGLEGFSLRHFTDQVVFVGENVARANRSRIGRTPGVTVRNVIAAPPRPALGARAALRGELGAVPEAVVLIATGRLTDQKNPEGLLRAFARLAAEVPQARLWLVGDGPLRGAVEALRRDLGLEAQVSLLGERDDVGALLAAADVFVLPSVWEGLPLGLLEAMAQGLPVVATDVGDVGHVVTAGAGLLVPPMLAGPGDPGDAAFVAALASLAADPDLRRDLGEGARQAARPFTDVEGWYRQLRALYRADRRETGAAP